MALNASDGSVRWWHDSGAETIFPTILQSGVVYASSSDGTVYAFSARDGAVLWSFKALLHTRVVAVVNGVVYMGSDDETRTHYPGHQYSYALNASNGDLLWRFTRGKEIGPVVNGIAYVESDQAATDRTLLRPQCQ